MKYDINGIYLKSLDYEILEAFCQRVKIKHPEDIQIDKKAKIIRYKNRKFSYYFRINQLVFCEQKEDKIYTVGKRVSKGKPIKSNHGRVRTNRKILVVGGLALILGVSAFKNHTSTLAPPVELETEAPPVDPTPQETKPIVQTEPPEITIDSSEVETENEQLITVTLPEVVAKDYQLEKRITTDNIFGPYIAKYADKYGLDKNFLSALISQERADNYEKDKNLGQITDLACGRGYTCYMYQNEQLEGKEKIFLLPSFYNDYPLKDLETMGTFPKFTSEEQAVIQKAIAYQKQGYKVYRKKDFANNYELNIQVTSIILADLIAEKQDLWRGAAAYHAGSSRVAQDANYDDIFSGINSAQDPMYLPNIIRYFTEEDYQKGFTIMLNGNQKVHYILERTLKETQNEETENIIRR